MYLLPIFSILLISFLPAAAPKSQKKVESEELSDLMPKARAIRNFEPASSLDMRVQVWIMEVWVLSHQGLKV